MSVTGRALLKAPVASFSVFPLPIFTVHIFYLWGWAIGAVRDGLFALGTRNGAEVYRRYFRKYTRTRMAFLGARHLAVTRVDLDRGGGWIDVLQIPDDVAGP